jgi:hypothetical protein
MKRLGSLITCFIFLSFGLFLFSSNFLVYAQGQEKPAVMTLNSSLLSVISVGDREKFEEDHWVTRNVSGGIEDFNYFKEYTNGDSLEIGARAIAYNDDYAFNVDYQKEGVGSLKFAFKEFRKYYDGTGGYGTVNFVPRFFETGKDLHLDIGSFKLEGILAREGAPKYTFAYERAFRNGDKSILGWYRVNPAVGERRYIFPGFFQIDEAVNKFKFGVEHKIKGVNVSAEQRYENATAEQDGIYREEYNLPAGTSTVVRAKYDDFDYDFYSTILRCDKTWAQKVYSSLGFMYNRYIGGSIESLSDTGISSTYLPSPATMEQNSVVFLPNVSFSPSKDLSMDVGMKFEYIKKNGYSSFYLDSDGNGVTDEITDTKTGREDRKFGQNFGLKYKKFKNVVFYFDGDFEQRFIDLHEKEAVDSAQEFARITNSNEFDTNYAVGSKWYLLSRVDVTAEFRNKIGRRDYKHLLRAGILATSYPAYIQELEFTTYSPVLKLNYKPSRWINFNIGYNYDMTSYGVRAFASNALAMNNYKAHVYSLNVMLTPADSMYLTLFYQKKNAATRTRANGDGGSATIVPIYQGGADVAGLTFSLAPDEKNTITGSYSMSRTDNNNARAATSFPMGANNFSQTASMSFEHLIRTGLSVEFKYSFMQYVDDINDGIDNYEANLISAGLKMKF